MSEFTPKTPAEEYKVVIHMGRESDKRPDMVINMGRRGRAIATLAGAELEAVKDKESKIGDVTITGSAESPKLGDGIEAFVGGKVTGLKHAARQQITEFERREYKRAGTFGKGFYLGANAPIASTDLNEIRSGEHFEHDVEVKGNILSIDLDSYALELLGAKLPDEVSKEFYEHERFGGASLLLEHPIDGVMYDALVFHRTTIMDEGPVVQTEAIVRDPHASATITHTEHHTK